jgi:hypothetical protein
MDAYISIKAIVVPQIHCSVTGGGSDKDRTLYQGDRECNGENTVGKENVEDLVM